jgi:HPt (histidine-containing phosphotransfer) domain-containing protein
MDPIRSDYEDDLDMLEIIREFAEELPDRDAALQECFASGDMAKLQTLAHQLKGAGGGYGFSPISEAAARLEANLREGAEAGVIKDDLTLLCEVLRAVVVPEAD